MVNPLLVLMNNMKSKKIRKNDLKREENKKDQNKKGGIDDRGVSFNLASSLTVSTHSRVSDFLFFHSLAFFSDEIYNMYLVLLILFFSLYFR